MKSQCVYKTNVQTQTHTDNTQNSTKCSQDTLPVALGLSLPQKNRQVEEEESVFEIFLLHRAVSRGLKIQVSVAEPPPPARREIFGASKNLGQNVGEKPTEPELNSAPSCVAAQSRRGGNAGHPGHRWHRGRTQNNHLLLLRGSELVKAPHYTRY